MCREPSEGDTLIASASHPERRSRRSTVPIGASRRILCPRRRRRRSARDGPTRAPGTHTHTTRPVKAKSEGMTDTKSGRGGATGASDRPVDRPTDRCPEHMHNDAMPSDALRRLHGQKPESRPAAQATDQRRKLAWGAPVCRLGGAYAVERSAVRIGSVATPNAYSPNSANMMATRRRRVIVERTDAFSHSISVRTTPNTYTHLRSGAIR